jgi:hypothetical protein
MNFMDDVLRERLKALAGFLPAFEEPGFQFGTWQGGKQKEPGVFSMPYFAQSETAASFVRMAYEQGWMQTDFSWPSWMKTEEAIALRDDPDALATASPEQLAKLLTVLIRQDRFVEGGLNSAFEAGLLTAIARRAEELVNNY